MSRVSLDVKRILVSLTVAGVVALLVLIMATAALGGVWLPGQQPSESSESGESFEAPRALDAMYRPSIVTLPVQAYPFPKPKPKPQPVAQAAPAPSGDVWGRLRGCESSDGRTSPNGLYHGYFQFHMNTWRSHGGTGHPMNHSYEHQKEIAKRVLASQGWGAWPYCSRKLGLR